MQEAKLSAQSYPKVRPRKGELGLSAEDARKLIALGKVPGLVFFGDVPSFSSAIGTANRLALEGGGTIFVRVSSRLSYPSSGGHGRRLAHCRRAMVDCVADPGSATSLAPDNTGW